MRKSPSGENKTSAIIRFFIGLCALTILVFVAYYFVAVQDWSFIIRDDTATRTVKVPDEQTVSPFDTPTAQISAAESEESGTPEPDAPTEAPAEETPFPVVSATPTAEPTFTPRPMPTPVPAPTPVPTKIPASSITRGSSRKFNMPAEGANGQIGISNCYVSKPDGYQVMVLEGWCYLDDEAFNGEKSTTYLVTINETTGDKVLYTAANVEGVSERAHKSVCMNPEAADWRVTMDVSAYKDGIYRLAVGVGYKPSGSSKKQYVVFNFDPGYTFTVLNGEILSGVQTTVEE